VNRTISARAMDARKAVNENWIVLGIADDLAELLQPFFRGHRTVRGPPRPRANAVVEEFLAPAILLFRKIGRRVAFHQRIPESNNRLDPVVVDDALETRQAHLAAAIQDAFLDSVKIADLMIAVIGVSERPTDNQTGDK